MKQLRKGDFEDDVVAIFSLPTEPTSVLLTGANINDMEKFLMNLKREFPRELGGTVTKGAEPDSYRIGKNVYIRLSQSGDEEARTYGIFVETPFLDAMIETGETVSDREIALYNL